MDLYIVGAGGFGREILSWAIDCPEWDVAWKFKGFLDDGVPKGHLFENGGKVVDSIKEFKPKKNDVLLNGIANVDLKKKLLPTLKNKQCNFVTLVHPTAIMGRNVKIGYGAVICPHSILTCDINLGDFCSLNINCAIGHNVKAAEFLHMNSFSEICGDCVVGKSVLIGSHALVLQNKTLGDHSIVGAGSVVTSSVKENTTVFGNPAQILVSNIR